LSVSVPPRYRCTPEMRVVIRSTPITIEKGDLSLLAIEKPLAMLVCDSPT